MPRRRTTRAQTTRAKPKLQGSAEDELGMTTQERKAKLANLIKDFDYNMENVRTRYEEELEALQKEIEKHFYHIRCKLSPMELEMTVEKYIDFTQSVAEEEKDEVTTLSRTTVNLSSLQNSRNTLSKYRSRQMIETIPEEGAASGPQTAAKRGGRRKVTKNQGQGVTFNAEPFSTVPNNFITPATQRNIATTGWGATPLVTPKFDPRLPITPANSRSAKPGEVTMSLAGSPINVDNNGKRTLVLKNKGEDIDIEIPEDSDIHSLMSTLRDIMKKGQDAQT